MEFSSEIGRSPRLQQAITGTNFTALCGWKATTLKDALHIMSLPQQTRLATETEWLYGCNRKPSGVMETGDDVITVLLTKGYLQLPKQTTHFKWEYSVI